MGSTSISNAATFDYLIIGAGIVGLTTALELKKRRPSARIAVLEKESGAGSHASGRNSGVLHSGIYYPPNTLKAQVCAAGSRAMQAFAAEHGIPCFRWGKIIIATKKAEQDRIDVLMSNARENGIRAERLDADGIARIEPYAERNFGGVFSPDTCVIDSLAVVQKCVELLRRQGVEIIFGAAVKHVDASAKTVSTTSGAVYRFAFLINCAGAHADRIARQFGLAQHHVLVPFKGIYFQLRPDHDTLVHSSIYPVPNLDLPFLGVHFTRVASGKVYVGPTAIPAFGRENYGFWEGFDWEETLPILKELTKLYAGNHYNMRDLVNIEVRKYLKPFFVSAARKLVPSLRYEDLLPSSKVGIRPQLVNTKDRRLEMDYILEKTPESLHVLNAISPAFTSSFAFAQMIVSKIDA